LALHAALAARQLELLEAVERAANMLRMMGLKGQQVGRFALGLFDRRHCVVNWLRGRLVDMLVVVLHQIACVVRLVALDRHHQVGLLSVVQVVDVD